MVWGWAANSNGLAINDYIILPFLMIATLASSGLLVAPGSWSEAGLITALVFMN
jgi:hypothetical protein